MKTILRAACAMTLLTLMLLFETTARTSGTEISGRIIAYRPVDRVVQVASFVQNREVFLFEIDAQKRGNEPKIVKIEYEHFGYSDVTETILQEAPMLRLRVKRDRTCDQSYDKFVSTAPMMRVEGSATVTSEGIAFVEKFKGLKFTPKLFLRCYKLEKIEFDMATHCPRTTPNSPF